MSSYKYRGKLISIEGNDGVGKSTQAKILASRLNHRYTSGSAVLTKEPSDTTIGDLVREVICKKNVLKDTQLLLIAAARVEHIEDLIKPNLQAGKIVVTDRFIHSSMVYQDPEKAALLQKHFADDLYPDITFILDTDVSTLRKRIHSRYLLVRNDTFDNAPVAEFERRRKEFLRYVDNKKVILIDAMQEERKVADDIWSYTLEHVLRDLKKEKLKLVSM